jgi:hypothetical protein
LLVIVLSKNAICIFVDDGHPDWTVAIAERARNQECPKAILKATLRKGPTGSR